jgi:hypothetical protein
MMGDVRSINELTRQPSIPDIVRSRRSIERALGLTVYFYAYLAAFHWASVARILNGPPDRLWCGNVILDPLYFLLKTAAPTVAGCVAVLVWRRIQARRRPLLPITILPVFIGTTMTLVLETFWLRDYGINLTHSIWWLPLD